MQNKPTVKTSLKKIMKQRRIVEQKIETMTSLNEPTPPSGWIRAIRVSLGLSIRQLAELVGVTHASINQIERREPLKRVTLSSLEVIAEAMDCKLVYAIIPKNSDSSLEKILEHRALNAAAKILSQVDHTMKLEAQGTNTKALKIEVKRLARELIETNDPLIWETSKP